MFVRIHVENRRLGKEDGQALLEFALVIPLLLMVILGFVDFGLGYNYKNDETNLANEAVRYAIVNHCTPCADQGISIEDYVKSNADSADLRNGGGQIDPPGVSVCFSKSDGTTTAAVGDALEAKVTATYNFLPSLLSYVPGLPTKVTITSTATQRLAQPYPNPSGPNAYTINVTCP